MKFKDRNAAIISNLTASSAAAVTSKGVSMDNTDQVTFIIGYGTAIANLPVSAQVVQSADAALSTNSTVGLPVVLGSTAANRVSGAFQILITVSSNTTDGETLVINGTSFVTSTNTTASVYTFGSTAGTTAAGGINAIATSLAAKINTYLPNLTASNPTTATVRISVNDAAATSILAVSTGANLTVAYEKAQAIIEVNSAMLDSTSKYVGLQLSSVATAIQCSVATIKSCNRFTPGFKGTTYTAT